LIIQVSFGDAAVAGIDPPETRAEGRSSMRATHTRVRADGGASGASAEPIPSAHPLPLSDGDLMAKVSAGSVGELSSISLTATATAPTVSLERSAALHGEES
jgi:hypothetical protein